MNLRLHQREFSDVVEGHRTRKGRVARMSLSDMRVFSVIPYVASLIRAIINAPR